ncbi:hypothetical protein QJS10_CPA03g00730 [Acorus calamus]|uniref:Sec16 Sec23-binding domain-containing protein n=1 Tax=Acorus calamus TaxID=4465 RepID=A0AAV9F8E1_ACOCL|nr:hypothetical protein QJS10_CPA03g00730 [Acorus calamus]
MMACIKSASRSALAAFAPDAPYLAAGTMAGAVDFAFSSSANLEIFGLDFQSEDRELPLVGSCPTKERFNRVSWGRAGSGSESFSLGVIAGGLSDGSIGVWNPLRLMSPDDNEGPLVVQLERHQGPVRGLEFNEASPYLLASGADGGEICIWDLSNPAEPIHFPSLRSTGSITQGEISFLSWNHKYPNIFASTSYNGISVVWDLRHQKPVTSFADSSRTRCSVLQWNPDISTHIVVASDDDNAPSLKVWDVRKTISPVKEFVGHTKGVIAMSWCPNDSSFLLTCAKDNRTICWDTSTGEIVCELPASTNWNFDVHWYPKIPGVISASSFDVKIGIYNIEACSRAASGESGFSDSLSTISTAHLRAPKWLRNPVGVSFGFGGRLISFQPNSLTSASEVYVHNLVTESNLVTRSTEFEAAVQSGDKASLRTLCERKSNECESEEDREMWGFLKVMFEEDGTARSKLLSHLGFIVHNEENAHLADEVGQDLIANLSVDERVTNKTDGVETEFLIDDGDDFFNNLQPSDYSSLVEGGDVPNGEQTQPVSEGSGETPDSSFDEAVQRALVVGDFKGAVSQCISSNRMTDALVIAHVGGPSLWESTRDEYLKKSHVPYLKVVSAMVNKDLLGLVKTRPLSSWKETLALLCSLAQGEEWTSLCDTLASRLMGVGNTLAATLCYICAGNIEKTVEIWSRNLKSEHKGKTYVDLLQDLMEKTIVLVWATGQKRFSSSLSKLVENYAELLASQGLLTTAMEYLKLLESESSSDDLAILRDRIAHSVEDREESRAFPFVNTQSQTESMYGAEQSSFSRVDNPQHYYQEKLQPPQQQSIPGSPYGEGYQQPFNSSSYGAGYQSMPQKQQYQEYAPPVAYQSVSSPQLFVPPQAPQVPQSNYGASPITTQPPKSFVPATPPALKNVEQYQPPTLGSQLYPGSTNPTYQPGASGSGATSAAISQTGPGPVPKFPPSVAPAPVSRPFMPVNNPGFVQRPALGPMQPSGISQPAPAPSSSALPAPTPTVQTVDTSNVAAELKPVVVTLTRIYLESLDAAGGPRAPQNKKRDLEDISKKIGALFAKLNTGDISPNVASKLSQLCEAVDSGNFSGALHIQVMLTTTDWEECNAWLSVIKRLIKMKQQNVR